MIVTSPQEFLERFRALPASRPAVPRAVVLMLDEDFAPGEETAADNRYMDLVHAADPERALAQQQELARTISALGVPVIVLAARPDTPDAVFPNNVFGTAPGRFVIGSMCHPQRRLEAEREDLPLLFEGFGYQRIDLRQSGCVAELTGPLVIDRARGLGLCGMTARVDAAGCQAMHDAFDLGLSFRFELAPGEYHTNVVMAVLAGRAVVLHPGSFADPDVPAAIAAGYGDAALELDDDEKAAFAGNCIAVTGRDVLISATAKDRLRTASRAFFDRHGFRLHAVAVDELEKAGGSVRCMVCEVF